MGRKTKQLEFTEDDVKVLKGLDGVRGKAEMYIGSRDNHGVFTCIREPGDNVGDEWGAGRAENLMIIIGKDGLVSIHDDGQGMPVKKHKTEKISTLTVLVSMLHAGGKLDSGSAYKNAKGCFVGETTIMQPDGKTRTIESLYNDYLCSDPTMVRSIDRETGNIKLKPVQNVQLTKYVTQAVKVNLSNGHSFTCTEDHPLYGHDLLQPIKAADSLGAVLIVPTLRDDDGSVWKHLFHTQYNKCLDGVSIEDVLRSTLVPNGYTSEPEVIQALQLIRRLRSTYPDIRSFSELKSISPSLYKEVRTFIDEDEYFLAIKVGVCPSTQLLPWQTQQAYAFRGHALDFTGHPDTQTSDVYVESVEPVTFDKPTPVYDLTIPDDHNYQLGCGVIVGNTHGIGIKATNAMSDYFRVETYRDGSWWATEYSKGKLKSEPAKIKKPLKRPYKKGTSIYFKLDPTMFDKGCSVTSEEVIDSLNSWASIQSYFLPGFRIKLDATALGFEDYSEVYDYYEPDGISAYIANEVEELGASPLLEDVPMFQCSLPNAEVALVFTDATDTSIDGYTNGLYQPSGGNHVQLVKQIIGNALIAKAGVRRAKKLDANAITDGIVGVINAKLDSPKFAGQTKERLSDARLKDFIYEDLEKEITKFFNKHKDLLDTLLERAEQLTELKKDFKLNVNAARTLKKVKKEQAKFNMKFSRAKAHIPFSEREVLLVEGDSAGGGARTTKHDCQTIVPMKGKLVNGLKDFAKFMANNEVLNILSATGYDPDAKDPLSKIECGKVILLSDSDSDGLHINTLELVAYYLMMPQLIEAGMLYVVDSPRYYARSLVDPSVFYSGQTMDEVNKKVAKGDKIGKISYLKGWGELPPEILAAIALTPGTRKLIRITMPKDKKAIKQFENIMGKDTIHRAKMFDLE